MKERDLKLYLNKRVNFTGNLIQVRVSIFPKETVACLLHNVKIGNIQLDHLWFRVTKRQFERWFDNFVRQDDNFYPQYKIYNKKNKQINLLVTGKATVKKYFRQPKPNKKLYSEDFGIFDADNLTLKEEEILKKGAKK